MPDERIVRLPRSENFWQAGPWARAARAPSSTSTAASTSAAPEDLPGGDNDRFLEFWNLVFMQYLLKDGGSLEPLPKQNIDTGLGLDRVAAILQDVPSVFETDQLGPLVGARRGALGPRATGSDPATTRALRVLADHSRAMTFLIADGVVPSNEDRGYILRRIMRRAIQQGARSASSRRSSAASPTRRSRRWASPIPSSRREQETIHEWLAAEEESFGRTLEQGTRLLARGDRRREGQEHLVDRPPTTPSSCTTPSASRTT